MPQTFEPLYIVDRIENGKAILIAAPGSALVLQLEVPVAKLPGGAQAQGIYRLTAHGWIFEPMLTAKLKADILRLLDNVWNTDAQTAAAIKAGTTAARLVTSAGRATLTSAKATFAKGK